MKNNRINLIMTASILCCLSTVWLQATTAQSQEFMDRLAIAQAPESAYSTLADSMQDNASQINQHATTAQALQAVSETSDDLYKANKKNYDNKANAAIREFHHTSHNAAEKLKSSLEKLKRHNDESTRTVQKLIDDAKRLTKDVHDAFIKAHKAISNSEMTIHPAKKQKVEEPKPVKKKKKASKKTSAQKPVKKKSKKDKMKKATQDMEDEIA